MDVEDFQEKLVKYKKHAIVCLRLFIILGEVFVVKIYILQYLSGVPWILEVISTAIMYKDPSHADQWAEFLMDLATSFAVSFRSTPKL